MARGILPSEHQSQSAVIAWWQLACHGYGLPPFALYAVPNAARRSFALAARMKAEGMRAGIPDLCLARPRYKGNAMRYAGLYVEMKRKGTGTVSDAQGAVLDYLRTSGYAAMVCYSADEAIEVIKEYLK